MIEKYSTAVDPVPVLKLLGAHFRRELWVLAESFQICTRNPQGHTRWIVYWLCVGIQPDLTGQLLAVRAGEAGKCKRRFDWRFRPDVVQGCRRIIGCGAVVDWPSATAASLVRSQSLATGFHGSRRCSRHSDPLHR